MLEAGDPRGLSAPPDTTDPSRRALLGLSASLATGPVTAQPALAGEPEADAALIQACQAMIAATHQLWAFLEPIRTIALERATEAERAARQERVWQLEDDVLALRARSLAGVRSKALALYLCYPDGPRLTSTTADSLAWSVIADLVELHPALLILGRRGREGVR